MYKKEDMCAVVISFNCDETLVENVFALSKQVMRIVIIDNCSTDCRSIKILDNLKQHSGVEVIFDTENRGVAAQLNRGLEICSKYEYSLMLTMDQDTVLNDSCVAEMLAVMNENDNIVSVGPNRKMTNKRGDSFTIANYLITSGNLVQVERAKECGGFFTDLFIDLVDIDFSLAIRKKGYQLARANNAFMKHKVGEYEVNSFMGRKIQYLTHSYKRFYYIYRNNIIVFRKFFKSFPIDCLKMEAFQFKSFVKMLLIEKNKKDKLKNIKCGILEGIKYKFN